MGCELSVVIPTLDEASAIASTLQALASARRRGVEVVVVDAGSHDETVSLAMPLADRVLQSARGRAQQMNVGAQAASGRVLCFLHADSTLPDRFDTAVLEGIGHQAMAWGRFDVHIEGRHRGLAAVAAMMNLRSRISGIATGDQSIFATRALFEALGGFPEQPLMEDVEFSKRAKRVGRPICLRDRVRTSGRRWERNGFVATVLLMWRLRLAYYLGVDPAHLQRRYGETR